MVAIDIRPSLEEVRALALNGNVIPVFCEEFDDLVTPVSAYLKVADGSTHSFLLESVTQGERLGRYSFIGVNPYEIIKTGEGYPISGDPLKPIEERMKNVKYVQVPGLPPFTGGAIGFVTYDCIRHFEPRTNCPLKDGLPFLPEALFMFCNSLVIFDHIRHSVRIVSHVRLDGFHADISGHVDPVSVAYERACADARVLLGRLQRLDTPVPRQGPVTPSAVGIDPNHTRAEYEGMVLDLKKHINCGDIIQAVPSRRLVRETDVHPFNMYRHLRSLNPSPYMFFVDCEDFQIVGASPETLVKVTSDGLVINHPIAGTRKRGATPEEDEALAKELLADEKERAEHIMLVDLGRNDVNRVCDPRTVKVDSLMHIERYSHVMHIVSQVSGKLRSNLTPFDAFRSIFPAGTVSGAPKIRAIELVYALEKKRRGIYAGGVGYFSFGGEIDTCIAIRTMMMHDGKAYLQAGGGIVFDSNPKDEYEETVNKLGGNVAAIRKAELYYAVLQSAQKESADDPSAKRQRTN